MDPGIGPYRFVASKVPKIIQPILVLLSESSVDRIANAYGIVFPHDLDIFGTNVLGTHIIL